MSEQEYRQKQIAHSADVNGRVNNQQQYAEAERLDQENLDQKREKLNAERQKLKACRKTPGTPGSNSPTESLFF